MEVTPTNIGVNPYHKWIHLAKTVDAWRIFPRVFVAVYIYLLYEVVIWFMTLEAPNLEQAGLVSIIVGAMAAVLKALWHNIIYRILYYIKYYNIF